MPLPTTFNPANANFQVFTNVGNKHIALAGLAGLAACGMVGVGAFFGWGSVVAGTATEAGITINGVTYYGISQATAEAIAATGSGAISQEAATAIVGSAIMGGGSALDAAALIALFIWQPPPPVTPAHHGNFGSYLGGFTGLGAGGFAEPPGFPGFPGGGHGWNGPGGATGCGWVIVYYPDDPTRPVAHWSCN